MLRIALTFLLATAVLAGQAPSQDQLRQEASERVSAQAKEVQVMVDSIFSFSELG